MVARFAARLALLVPFAVVLSSCEHNPGPPDALLSISVSRNPDTLVISTARTFKAMGHYASGDSAAISPVWSVATAGGGAISATSGIFVASTVPGTFSNTITATLNGISGTATVTVVAGPPATIVVSPTPQTLATGGAQQFTAVIKDVAGNVLSVVPNWSVAAGGGTTNTTGMFTAGMTSGTFNNTVVASVGSLSGTATVIVTVGALSTITVTPNPQTLAIGATQQFTAVGRDANGNVVSMTPTWTVEASGGGINSSGMFTAGTVAGTFNNTVKAASGGISGFATVTVNPGVLASIAVTPTPVTVQTNATQQFTAVGRDANNNVIPISPTWSVDAGHAGGTVLNPSGVYTAPNLVGAGFDSVRATSGTISGAGRANVTASGQLMTISVTPNPGNTQTGGQISFTATGFDAQGSVVPTPGLVWSVVPAVGGGTINSGTGVYTAGGSPGTYNNSVKAQSGSVSGFATVVVTAAPVVVGPPLGAAATHGLLAGSTFTCAGAPSTINADASVWPGIAYTGFPPCEITGQQHAGDSYAQTAQGDLTTAYLALEAMPCDVTITSDLGGTTLAPGVYCSGSTVGSTGTVTLDGGGNINSLFVIRAGSSLTGVGSVLLQNGAQAKNVYWWNGASATIGIGSAWKGNIIALSTITLNNNTTLLGRALARNGAVTIGTGTFITLP